MTQLHADYHLRQEDVIAVAKVLKSGTVMVDVGPVDDTVLVLYVVSEQLPQRLAEFEAIVARLREVIDGVIATPHEPEDQPTPAYDTVLVADLTPGRRIQRCGVDPADRWREVVGVAAHPWLPDVVLVDLDGDECATLNERDAVRVMVADLPGVAEVPVGETAEVA